MEEFPNNENINQNEQETANGFEQLSKMPSFKEFMAGDHPEEQLYNNPSQEESLIEDLRRFEHLKEKSTEESIQNLAEVDSNSNNELLKDDPGLAKWIKSMQDPNPDESEEDREQEIENGKMLTALLPFIAQEYSQADTERKTTIRNVIDDIDHYVYRTERGYLMDIKYALDRQKYEYYDDWDPKEDRDHNFIFLGTKEASFASEVDYELETISLGYEIDNEKVSEESQNEEETKVATYYARFNKGECLKRIMAEDPKNIHQRIKQDIRDISNSITSTDTNVPGAVSKLINLITINEEFQKGMEALKTYKTAYSQGERMINSITN